MHLKSSAFPHVLDSLDVFSPPSDLRDIWMMMAGNLIRDKPEWWRKIEDDFIWGTWIEELSAQYDNESDVVTEKMKEYIRAECRFIAKNMNHQRIFDALDLTFKSDHLIPPELKEELKNNVAILENVPERHKDWHPGSDNKVVDLVHPSLYPLVYNKSLVLGPRVKEAAERTKRCLPYSCSGSVVVSPKTPESSDEFSDDFQWLPSEFSIDPGTKECKFTSYINNLHPIYHKRLYYTLEKVLSCCFPIVESVLASLRAPRIRRTETVDPYNWYEEPEISDGASEDEHYQNRVLKMPEAVEFTGEDRTRPMWTGWDAEGLGMFSDFGHGQVIVKLANIELTPEKPEYQGGGWHIEGMLNERIVATVIYYYSSENITDNRLSFRQRVDAPDYEQNDDHGVKTVYGLENEGALNQKLGYIITKEDRVIGFPNVHQHKVSPFKLRDPTKPGHRKILCFFFVDPHVKITSTADIAPQQFDWWKEDLLRIERFRRLPGEIFENVMKFVDWPMNMEEAKETRLRLIEERSIARDIANEDIFESEFSLCEH